LIQQVTFIQSTHTPDADRDAFVAVPFTFIAFAYCQFHENSVDLLQQFFQSQESLQHMVWNRNIISNLNLARILKHAPYHSALIVKLPREAEMHNRHEIIRAVSDNVEQLDLEGFSEISEEVALALTGMRKLKKLKISGGTISDQYFSLMVQGFCGREPSVCLKYLRLDLIRGLTCASLREFQKLARQNSYEHTSVEERNHARDSSVNTNGLNELYIHRLESLFQQDVGDGVYETAPLEQVESFFANVSIPKVTITESSLTQTIDRAVFRGLAKSQSGSIHSMRWRASRFGDEEFRQLLICLPHIQELSSLHLELMGRSNYIESSSKKEVLVKEIRQNTSLTRFNISHRGIDFNGASYAPLGEILQRNKNIRLVQNVLQMEGRNDLVSMALSKVMSEPGSTIGTRVSALYLLLNDRIASST